MSFFRVYLLFGSLLVPLAGLTIPSAATPQNRQGGFTRREPNLYAPNLYADKIDFVATLTKLPGADNKQSHWELSYQLFFIPEEKYYQAVQSFPKGGSNPTPEQFPGRILLAEGRRTKSPLTTPQERTFTLTGVPFKQKIPDLQRTKFSYLMTSYSVKIFDAELKTTVYYSGIFLVEPYEDSNNQNQVAARKTLYASFGVNRDGSLDRSQMRPKTITTQ